jgi:hypothetical protein
MLFSPRVAAEVLTPGGGSPRTSLSHTRVSMTTKHFIAAWIFVTLLTYACFGIGRLLKHVL